MEPPVRSHVLSPAHESFVSTEIQRELRIGAIRRWGTVGEATPPRLVLPVGVEPSKPRKLNEPKQRLRIPYLHNPLRLDNLLRLGDSPRGECNGLPLWERPPMWGVGLPLWGKTPPVLNKMISSGWEGLPRWAVR